MAKTILAVHDSPSMRRVMQLVPEGSGYRVVEATGGHDRLENVLGRQANVVRAGQNTSRMNGISLTGSLGELLPYRAMPILILTTESNGEMNAKGRGSGATGRPAKPFDPTRRCDVVCRAIG